MVRGLRSTTSWYRSCRARSTISIHLPLAHWMLRKLNGSTSVPTWPHVFYMHVRPVVGRRPPHHAHH
eukprot:11221123-Lingulodinium_polyedra.AAC.1